jgi:hypothetical protein
MTPFLAIAFCARFSRTDSHHGLVRIEKNVPGEFVSFVPFVVRSLFKWNGSPGPFFVDRALRERAWRPVPLLRKRLKPLLQRYDTRKKERGMGLHSFALNSWVNVEEISNTGGHRSAALSQMTTDGKG